MTTQNSRTGHFTESTTFPLIFRTSYKRKGVEIEPATEHEQKNLGFDWKMRYLNDFYRRDYANTDFKLNRFEIKSAVLCRHYDDYVCVEYAQARSWDPTSKRDSGLYTSHSDYYVYFTHSHAYIISTKAFRQWVKDNFYKLGQRRTSDYEEQLNREHAAREGVKNPYDRAFNVQVHINDLEKLSVTTWDLSVELQKCPNHVTKTKSISQLERYWDSIKRQEKKKGMPPMFDESMGFLSEKWRKNYLKTPKNKNGWKWESDEERPY